MQALVRNPRLARAPAPAGDPPSAAPDRSTVLVAASDPLARSGLILLLDREPDLAAIPILLADGEARAPFATGGARVAVFDLGLDPQAALPACARIAREVPLLALVPRGAAARVALGAGARGVLIRTAEPARIAAAIRALVHGLVVADAAFASAVLRPPATGADALVEALTVREAEVLALLARGLSNRLIAARLGVSEHTAKFHVNAILGKLGAQSRTEAVVRAARLGLVAL
jgi:DNA-binding NarL/FixJ family response regulator